MDQKRFRNFVKMTKLMGGGLKENDVSIIFVEACYVGTRAFYDHEQFGAALAAIAVKKKLAYPELLKYVLRVTDELMEQEIDKGNTIMIDYQQKTNPYNIALQKKRLGNIRRVAPAPPTHISASSSSSSSLSLEKLTNKNTNVVIKPGISTNSTDSLTKSATSTASSLSSNVKKMKASVKAFSLTDFLLDREKEKTLESLNAQLAGKSRKIAADEDELKPGWDDKIGKHSVLMTESPETWGWA